MGCGTDRCIPRFLEEYTGALAPYLGSVLGYTYSRLLDWTSLAVVLHTAWVERVSHHMAPCPRDGMILSVFGDHHMGRPCLLGWVHYLMFWMLGDPSHDHSPRILENEMQLAWVSPTDLVVNPQSQLHFLSIF